MSSLIRRTLAVGLVGALAFLVFRPDSGAEDTRVDTRARLVERVETYTALRIQDDWPALYEMADPGQRRSLDLRAFLNAYAHGAMRVVSLSPRSTRFSKNGRAALVAMDMEGELVPEKLPANFRKSLNVTGPEDLRQRSDFELTWSWQDGDWYFELDRTLVKGRDDQGRVPQAYGAQIGPEPEVKR